MSHTAEDGLLALAEARKGRVLLGWMNDCQIKAAAGSPGPLRSFQTGPLYLSSSKSQMFHSQKDQINTHLSSASRSHATYCTNDSRTFSEVYGQSDLTRFVSELLFDLLFMLNLENFMCKLLPQLSLYWRSNLQFGLYQFLRSLIKSDIKQLRSNRDEMKFIKHHHVRCLTDMI